MQIDAPGVSEEEEESVIMDCGNTEVSAPKTVAFESSVLGRKICGGIHVTCQLADALSGSVFPVGDPGGRRGDRGYGRSKCRGNACCAGQESEEGWKEEKKGDHGDVVKSKKNKKGEA